MTLFVEGRRVYVEKGLERRRRKFDWTIVGPAMALAISILFALCALYVA